MPGNSPHDEPLRAWLGRTPECPPIEALERILDQSHDADPRVRTHAANCAFCKTELRMLKSFLEAEVPASDSAAIRQITSKLREKPHPASSWIERMFGTGWLRPTAMALAGVLIVIAIGLQWRHRSPALDTTAGSNVFRSGTVVISSPVGDLQNAPAEIRWEVVPLATRYEAHLMEVDHHELWRGESAQPNIAIPADQRAQIVPLKTLLIKVDAFDSSGRKVAESEVVRFRVLQNLYSH